MNKDPSSVDKPSKLNQSMKDAIKKLSKSSKQSKHAWSKSRVNPKRNKSIDIYPHKKQREYQPMNS